MLASQLASLFKGRREFLHAWISHEAQTVLIGKLPDYAYVIDVHIQVTEAFNSGGTDNVTVGWTGTTNALATDTDVATTGIKTVTLGANVGYNAAGQDVNAYYANGGTEPTTGKALVVVEFFRVKQPN